MNLKPLAQVKSRNKRWHFLGKVWTVRNIRLPLSVWKYVFACCCAVKECAMNQTNQSHLALIALNICGYVSSEDQCLVS